MHAIHFRPTVHLPREVVQSGRIAIVPALRAVFAGPGDMNGMGPRRRLQIPPEALLVLLFEPVAQGRQHGVVQRKALLQVADGENDVVDKPSHVTDAPSPLMGIAGSSMTPPRYRTAATFVTPETERWWLAVFRLRLIWLFNARCSA